MSKRIAIQQPVLQGNQRQADENKALLNEYSLLSINLLSSPGAGKTTFLEHLIPLLHPKVYMGVIEGDVATRLDSQRIASCGVPSVQINTHGACHLDANMISLVLGKMPLNQLDLLVIENVGNLVCPASFDLGEDLSIALLSTTEGSDKVVKYPTVFEQADVVVLNKIDLLPYIPFDLAQFKEKIKQTNPHAPVFEVSALNGEGMVSWIDWLMGKIREKQS